MNERPSIVRRQPRQVLPFTYLSTAVIIALAALIFARGTDNPRQTASPHDVQGESRETLAP